MKYLSELEIAALHAAGIRTREIDVRGATYWTPDPIDVQAFLAQLYDEGATLSQRTKRADARPREFSPEDVERMARQLCATSGTFNGHGMIEGLLERIDELKSFIEHTLGSEVHV
jgi:hypothetical protein